MSEHVPDSAFYDKAVDLYASDNIDVLKVSVDREGDGAWVSALVWVPKESITIPCGKWNCDVEVDPEVGYCSRACALYDEASP